MQRHHTTPQEINEKEMVSLLKQWAYPLNSKADLQPLIDRIGDSRIVMLGEASHGTHEFYTWRAHITRQLIQEKGFQFIAVEGDWPDCYRFNRFIKGLDVYSLWESLESIILYLEKTDRGALATALEAFRCFEPFQQEEGRDYARASQFVPELCQQMACLIWENWPGLNTESPM
jgi:erythromycin esterase-like protein